MRLGYAAETQLIQEQYDRIADRFPTQRGNVSLDNLNVICF